MIWLQFAATASVIVLAGVRLARHGDVLGEKTGLGRSWIGLYTPGLIAVSSVAMRVIFAHERQRRAQETQHVAEELQYSEATLRSALLQYGLAAVAVVAAALWLPRLGAQLAQERILCSDEPSWFCVRHAETRGRASVSTCGP